MGQPGFAGAVNRLIGTEGMVEVLQFDPARPFEAWVRARTKGRADWVTCTTPDSIHDSRHYLFAVEDLRRAIEQGREPELSGDRGRAAHEIVFAAFESAVRGGRVDLPLVTTDDRPLDALAQAQAT